MAKSKKVSGAVDTERKAPDLTTEKTGPRNAILCRECGGVLKLTGTVTVERSHSYPGFMGVTRKVRNYACTCGRTAKQPFEQPRAL